VNNRKRVDAEHLADVIQRINAAGVPESLVCYVILGSEWMFRLRNFGPHDAENTLRRIERRFRDVLHPDDAWVIVESLTSLVTKVVRQHRTLAVELEWQPPPLGFGMSELSVDASDRPTRTPPELLVSSRRGPAPWPAPWIAGLIIER